MKDLYFFLFFFMVFTSCKSNVSDIPLEATDVIESRNSSSDELIFKVFSDYTIFYSEYQDRFFHMQYTTPPVLTGAYEFVEFSGGIFKIRETTSRNILSFSFSQNSYHNIYGLGEFSGTDYNENYLIQSGGDIDITDNPQALSCTCKRDGTQPACGHGGVGSNACSVTDGGSLGVGGKNECSVSCNDGYYACCNEIARDDDGDE